MEAATEMSETESGEPFTLFNDNTSETSGGRNCESICENVMNARESKLRNLDTALDFTVTKERRLTVPREQSEHAISTDQISNTLKEKATLVAWSSRDRYLAVGYTDKKVWIHDSQLEHHLSQVVTENQPTRKNSTTQTEGCEFSVDVSAKVTALAWSPTTERLAVGDDYGNTVVLDLAADRFGVKFRTEVKSQDKNTTRTVKALTWTANEEYLAVGSKDSSVLIFRYEGEGYVKRFSLRSSSAVFSLAFGNTTSQSTKDEKYLLAVGSDDSKTVVVELKPRKKPEVQTVIVSGDRVRSVNFSVEDEYLCVGSFSKVVLIVDVKSWAIMYEIDTMGHIYSLAWSHDSSFLAVGSQSGAMIYHVTSGELAIELIDHCSVESVAFSSDGVYLAMAYEIFAHIEDISSMFSSKIICEIKSGGAVKSVAWSHDNKYICIGSDKTIDITNVETNLSLRTSGPDNQPASHVIGNGQKGEVNSFVWSSDAGTRSKIKTGEGQSEGKVNSIAWSSDFRYLAAGCDGIRATIFEITLSNDPDAFGGHICSTFWEFNKNEKDVNSVAWSPDNELLAVATSKKVHIIDVKNGTVTGNIIDGTNVKARIVAWRPNTDGCLEYTLAVGSAEGKATIHHLIKEEKGTKVHHRIKASFNSYSAKDGKDVRCLAWSHDGRYLAVGAFDKIVGILDVGGDEAQHGDMPQEQYKKAMHIERDGSVFSIAWSADDRYLAIGTDNKSLLIFDFALKQTWSEIAFNSAVTSLAWSTKDNSRLAVGTREAKTTFVMEKPLHPPPVSLVSLELSVTKRTLERNPMIVGCVDPVTGDSLLERAVLVEDGLKKDELIECLLTRGRLSTETIDERVLTMALCQHDLVTLERLLVATASGETPYRAQCAAVNMLPLLCLKVPSIVVQVFAKLELTRSFPVLLAVQKSKKKIGTVRDASSLLGLFFKMCSLGSCKAESEDIRFECTDPLVTSVLRSSSERDPFPVWKAFINPDYGLKSHALRVPWGKLSSRVHLHMFLKMYEMNYQRFDMKMFWESAVISSVISLAWDTHFSSIHRNMFVIFILEVICFIIFTDLLDYNHHFHIDGDYNPSTVISGICCSLCALYFLVWEVREFYASNNISQIEKDYLFEPASSWRGMHSLMAIKKAIWDETKKVKGKNTGCNVIFEILTEIFGDVWNLSDWVCQVLVLTCVIGKYTDMLHKRQLYLMAITFLPLLIKTLCFLRGFNWTGWLVTLLWKNFIDMRAFLFVIVTVMVFFGFSFKLIYSTHPYHTEGEDYVYDDEDHGTVQGFIDNKAIFLNMLGMGVSGDFDTGGIEHTVHEGTAQVFLFFIVISVTIVSFNALIAILGQSFAEAQENKYAMHIANRAYLILEYYNMMDTTRRKSIEKSLRWTHKLVPLGSILVAGNDDERTAAIRKVVNEEMNQLEKAVHDVSSEVMGITRSLEKVFHEPEALRTRASVFFMEGLWG